MGFLFQFFVFFIIFTVLCTPKIMSWIWNKFWETIVIVLATVIARQIMSRVCVELGVWDGYGVCGMASNVPGGSTPPPLANTCPLQSPPPPGRPSLPCFSS